MKLRKETITIIRNDAGGSQVRISAWASDDFPGLAVHKAIKAIHSDLSIDYWSNKWQVTHIPTGYSLTYTLTEVGAAPRTRREAIEFVMKLRDVADWENVTATSLTREEMWAVRDIIVDEVRRRKAEAE